MGCSWVTSHCNRKKIRRSSFCNRCEIILKGAGRKSWRKILEVKQSENLETSGGYAKEASDEYKTSRTYERSSEKNDIVICTALIPGKPAPRILNEELVKLMKPGSVIYDLASENGGNSAYSESGKINTVNGIKIIGTKKFDE